MKTTRVNSGVYDVAVLIDYDGYVWNDICIQRIDPDDGRSYWVVQMYREGSYDPCIEHFNSKKDCIEWLGYNIAK